MLDGRVAWRIIRERSVLGLAACPEFDRSVCSHTPLPTRWTVGPPEELGITATPQVQEFPSGRLPCRLGENGRYRLAQLFEFLYQTPISPWYDADLLKRFLGDRG